MAAGFWLGGAISVSMPLLTLNTPLDILHTVDIVMQLGKKEGKKKRDLIHTRVFPEHNMPVCLSCCFREKATLGSDQPAHTAIHNPSLGTMLGEHHPDFLKHHSKTELSLLAITFLSKDWWQFQRENQGLQMLCNMRSLQKKKKKEKKEKKKKRKRDKKRKRGL